MDYAVTFCLKAGKPPLLHALQTVTSINPAEASSALRGLNEKFTFLGTTPYPDETPEVISILLDNGWRPWREVVLNCLAQPTMVAGTVNAFMKSGVSIDFDVERDGPNAVTLLEDLLLHYKHEGNQTNLDIQDAVVRRLIRAGASVNEKVLALAKAEELPCSDLIAERLHL
jgi:hypothetical protein